MSPSVLGLLSVLAGSAPAVDAAAEATAPADPAEPAPEDARAHVALALAHLPPGPSIAAIQAAAIQRARVTPRTSRRWLARARAAAVLPSVTVELDARSGVAWGLDQEAGTADMLAQSLDGGRGFRIRAGWELDRLVFNLDELRAARAELDLVDWRERVLLQVTQLYFERQRLALESMLDRGDGVQAAIARRTRIAEIEAILTGLTGLSFQPSAPPPRPLLP